jgi:spermidine synthase
MIPPSALAVISAAILGYEVLLVRLFAIVQWHHFAFMAISIALLGFGVSGTLIVLFREQAERTPLGLFIASAAAFALTAPSAFLIAQRVPFNALEIVWAPSQILNLAAIFVLLAVPFTAGAACIGLAFREPGAKPGRVYLWNLLGSGAGALGVVGALLTMAPMSCLAMIGALGFAAALLAAAARESRRMRRLALLGALATGAWFAAPTDWTALRISEFKGLPQALAVRDARLIGARSGPLAALSVIESPTVPFRHAPGLSLMAPALPPPQLGVFADGAFATAIDLWDGRPESLAYLDHSPDALPYHLARPQDVLVLDAGGGRLVLQAILNAAGRVDAVESNPDMLALLEEDFAARAGALYARPEVQTANADARHFLTATERLWDVIQLPPPGGGATQPAQGLSEDYLFTAEGIGRAYAALRREGWLSASVGLDLPPRAALKLVSTLRAALELEGVAAPAGQILAIRSMTTMTVLVKRGAISRNDIAELKAFAETRGFDLVHYPGMGRGEANRRIRLAEPVFHDGVRSILGSEASDFVARYKFNIAAATDDRPYFHDVFRWAALPDLLALGPAGGAALIELGELIVTATLLQAIVLGAVLVLLPLRWRLSGRVSTGETWRFGLYFAALGLAFLFIEIAWIQRFVLFLGHPLYSVSVVLTGFLVFAALGAGVSARLERRFAGTPLTALDIAIGGIILVAAAYVVALSPVLPLLAGMPAALRVLAALAMIAPLAFFMGMPFPLGLSRIAGIDVEFVPWAWGLNGCASVVSAAAATLFSMNFGITATILAGILLYGAALLLFRRVAAPEDDGRAPPDLA